MIHLPVRSYVSNHYTDSNVRIRTHHQPVLRLSKYDLRLSRAPILHGEHTERSVIFSGDACRPRVTGINSAPKILIIRGAKREYGALGGIRTHDLSLRRAALYPAELQAHFRLESRLEIHGAEGESRTRTPLRALRPERSASAISPPRHEGSDTRSTINEI